MFFFIFSKFWFSGVLRGGKWGGEGGGGGVVKGQKMAQNDKKILPDSVLQEVYLMIVAFDRRINKNKW